MDDNETCNGIDDDCDGIIHNNSNDSDCDGDKIMGGL